LHVVDARKRDAIVTEDNVTNDNRSQRVRSPSPVFVIGGIVLALAGFAIGRTYPAHDYHQIGTSSYLFDTHTGKACAPFRDSQVAAERAIAAKGDIFDQVAALRAQGTDPASKDQALDPNDPWAVRARELQHKEGSDMIPACGSE
jgi:hypothetical protein